VSFDTDTSRHGLEAHTEGVRECLKKNVTVLSLQGDLGAIRREELAHASRSELHDLPGSILRAERRLNAHTLLAGELPRGIDLERFEFDHVPRLHRRRQRRIPILSIRLRIVLLRRLPGNLNGYQSHVTAQHPVIRGHDHHFARQIVRACLEQ
jgi:hypothetical protein